MQIIALRSTRKDCSSTPDCFVTDCSAVTLMIVLRTVVLILESTAAFYDR